MAYDNTEEEFHLTIDGWITGTYKFFGKIQGNNIARPEGTVETWTKHMEQASGWSKEHVNWSLSWYDFTISEEERKELRKKFQKPNHDFPD